MRINEGYEIIYSSQINNGVEAILAFNRKSGMYVTWLCKDGNNYFWGHYFSNEVEALRDLASRIEEEKNNG